MNQTGNADPHPCGRRSSCEMGDGMPGFWIVNISPFWLSPEPGQVVIRGEVDEPGVWEASGCTAVA